MLVGCSGKQPCTPYTGFSIVEKPEQLKLKIKNSKRNLRLAIDKLNEVSKNADDYERQQIKEVIQYLQEAVDDESCLAAVKQMKVKIKVLEKIIDQYEKDIRDYWDYVKKTRK